MTNLDKYQRVFEDVFDVKKDVLNDGFTFKDVPQWDSVAHLSLISALEDTFDVLFESEDILHFGSYENGKRLLRKMGINI